MRELESVVRKRTHIEDGYKEHASHRSMEFFIDDWVRARARLDRQIALLTKLKDQRKADTDAGVWPPKYGALQRREENTDG